MIVTVVFSALAVLSVGYVVYGRFLARQVRLDDSRPTPACAVNDGVDYVPAPASMLLGQHFSAIAAAGPIVGPILACLWFGWAPVCIWVVLGAIFVGGTHDFLSIIVSVRHSASSIGEIVRRYMSRTSQILFLVFVWFALVYVIIAFTDITAQTFISVSERTAFGPGVAFSSFFYLLIGLLMGVALKRWKWDLKAATAFFLPLVCCVIWAGTKLPADVNAWMLRVPVKTWEAVLLGYCLIASLIPMWLLLQPRGYLGGWFLYLTIGIALLGALFGNHAIRYPAFNCDGFKSLMNGKPLFPVLFITVACGACSGFHGIVGSGTTSKQICKESDTKVVGYGAMILEGLVAILALATVMMISPGDASLRADPNVIYARGLADYLGLVRIRYDLALAFALVAFSTFVYDTLDVCTRLARYILQELFQWKTFSGALAATLVTLSLPFVFLMATKEKAYLVAWPLFGTVNQLLAGLTLLVVSVWLIRTGRRAFYAIGPMAFMMIFTMWSLIAQIAVFVKALPSLLNGSLAKPDLVISGLCGIVLFILSLWLIVEAVNILVRKRPVTPAQA